MIIFVLFGLRKEDYPNQVAPEALEVADEFTMDENSEWLYNKKREAEKTKEFQTLEIISIEIDKSIDDILRKKHNCIKGKVK